MLIELLKERKPAHLIKFAIMSLTFVTSRTLMVIEDFVFPGLKEIEKEWLDQPGKVIFVLGHPRSGTTNIQSALVSHPDCFSGQVSDIIFASLIQKYAMQPFLFLVDFILNTVLRVNQKNHKMTATEPLEESIFLILCFFRSPIFTFSSLMECRELSERGSNFDDWQMRFVRQCMVRVIYFRRTPGKQQTYIGCPLNFCANMEITRKHFPHARFVVTVRDPKESFPSIMDYVTMVNKEELLSDSWRRKAEITLTISSNRFYKGMASWEGDDLTHWIDFNQWKKEGSKLLGDIWKTQGLSFTEELLQAALVRKESHKNRPEAY